VNPQGSLPKFNRNGEYPVVEDDGLLKEILGKSWENCKKMIL